MTDTCRIIPLGGLGEVGKNMTVFEFGDDIVIVDAGLAFPRDEHLGVDLLLPDLTYLRGRKGRIRAVILTHGHEDHVGGLPYLLREIDVEEVWATRLTLGLVKSKLDEHGLLRAAELREADPDADPVAIVGRSLRKNVNISRNLGYLEVPDDMILKPAELGEFPRDQQMILCTGSQGEPMSALTRIAYRDHQTIEIERGDTVILSAKPVPGNELRVHDAINRLTRLGAEVLHQEIAPVHVSGHGCAEELRTILSLVRPKAVMPVHGEFRMLDTHARLARDA